MTILAWDVETTGLPNFKERSADPTQPHIVQIGLCLYDEGGREIEAMSAITKPDGWTIPPEMTAIHGISQERAMDEGIPEGQIVGLYIMFQARARLRVAHNSSFDTRLARIAMTRAGIERDFIEAIEARQSYCTCTNAKLVLKLPPTDRQMAAGFSGFKSPKLEECVRHFFQEELPGAHDALIDARACGRVFFALCPPVGGVAQ